MKMSQEFNKKTQYVIWNMVFSSVFFLTTVTIPLIVYLLDAEFWIFLGVYFVAAIIGIYNFLRRSRYLLNNNYISKNRHRFESISFFCCIIVAVAVGFIPELHNKESEYLTVFIILRIILGLIFFALGCVIISTNSRVQKILVKNGKIMKSEDNIEYEEKY